MKDKTEYKVRVAGTMMDSHKTEDAAIEDAKSYLAEHNAEDVSVVYCSQSGTEHSTMQVWPTAGQMYSEHR